MNNFGWLVWKEYRQNRLIVWVGLVLLFGPHFMGLGIVAKEYLFKIHYGQEAPLPQTRVSPPWPSELFGDVALCSLMLSQLTIALLGGNAIASERVDRSSEFLFTLPVARSRILLSKATFGTASIAVIFLINGLIVCGSKLSSPPQSHSEIVSVALTYAMIGLVVYCISWFWSSLVSNPVVAVCGGLLTPILVASAFAIWYLPQIQVQTQCKIFGFLIYGTLIMIAPVAFLFGTWHYLRRVEP